MTRRYLMMVTGLLSVFLSASAQAQQFRVYTKVSRPATDPLEEPVTVARSLTLFHAGRVFDSMPAAGEVTIFEPSHQRFIVFNGRRMIAASVTFNEIERLLATAKDETLSSTSRLLQKNSASRTLVEPLRFQLDPKFNEQFSAADRRLSLTSPNFSYRVTCARPDIVEASSSYLNYTDWLARLNYVLSPGLYPEPRLRLNESLRSRQLIPLTVELEVNFDPPLRLQAEHQFGWQLERRDREDIAHWETLLRDDQLEWLSFRDYQRALLTSSSQAAR